MKEYFDSCIIIVRYYDDDRFIYEPDYDDSEVLVSLHIVPLKDKLKFIKKHTVKNRSSTEANGLVLMNNIPISNLHEYMIEVHGINCRIYAEGDKLVFPTYRHCQNEVQLFAQEFWNVEAY